MLLSRVTLHDKELGLQLTLVMSIHRILMDALEVSRVPDTLKFRESEVQTVNRTSSKHFRVI